MPSKRRLAIAPSFRWSRAATKKPPFWQPYGQGVADSIFRPRDAQLFAAQMSARPFLMRWAAVVDRNALQRCRVQVLFKASPQAACSWETGMRPCWVEAVGTGPLQPHRPTEATQLLSIRSHCRHVRAGLCWGILPRRAPPRLPLVRPKLQRKRNCSPPEQLPLHPVNPSRRREHPALPEPHPLNHGRTEKATLL